MKEFEFKEETNEEYFLQIVNNYAAWHVGLTCIYYVLTVMLHMQERISIWFSL